MNQRSTAGLLFIDLIRDGVQNHIKIFDNIVIPKAQNAVPLLFQVFCSLIIILRLIQMLAAI